MGEFSIETLRHIQPPLLIGVGGMLHRAWAELLARQELAHDSPPLPEFDLTIAASMRPFLNRGRKLVINCAAYTDVDGAEANEALAMAINGTGVGELASLCREYGAFLVHYSTDYVFNGHGRRPYLPDDPMEPIGAYGRTKAVGERLIRESGCQHLIIRTSWLYAPWAKNFVRTIAGLVRQQRPLRIVDDQRGRPTSAEHLAGASLRLLQRGAEGTYHVTDGGECTWYEFAGEIARQMDSSVPVSPISSAELNRPAPRPAYSVLDLAKTEQLIGNMTPWQEALSGVLSRLE